MEIEQLSNTRANEFIQKFENLIKEYNAEISVEEETSFDGDTFVTGIEIYLKGDEKNHARNISTFRDIDSKTKLNRF